MKRSHPQNGVDLSYIKQNGEAYGDAGDQYTGLDRFGRIVDQRWLNGWEPAVDRYGYGYDRNSNRTYKENRLFSPQSEVYQYDGMNQVQEFQRGSLNANKDGISGTASRSQSWDYDQLGNFNSVITNGTSQSRSHNAQNEIGTIG